MKQDMDEMRIVRTVTQNNRYMIEAFNRFAASQRNC